MWSAEKTESTTDVAKSWAKSLISPNFGPEQRRERIRFPVDLTERCFWAGPSFGLKNQHNHRVPGGVVRVVANFGRNPRDAEKLVKI